MTLSGNLGFVPVDEVLRLLTRSRQQGAVEVIGNGLRGRVFVGKGGIDLATTSDDGDLHRHLVNSGYTDENALRRVTSGETTLAAMAESNQAIVDLIREMTVESLYQISHRGDEFEVHEGLATPYASPKSFELEALLNDAAQREKDWAKVSEVVPDLTGAISFRRDLGERDEVAVKNDDWKVLSEIGTGSSISQIADQLGTTEFWAARVAARLVKSDLVELRASDDREEYAPAAETTWATVDVEPEDSDPVDDYTDPTDHEHQSSPEPSATYDEPASVFAADDEPEDEEPHAGSWWQEPVAEGDEPDEEEPHTPEVVAEGLSEMPSVEAVADDEADGQDVEEDTEAFLEKVFSELDSNESESEEGHGLLRRRRMGTLRDFSSDS